MEQALRLLRGEVPVPAEAAAALARVRAGFSDIELDALDGEGLPFDATPFRHALATRLRLALALEGASRSPHEPSKNALNELLAQVDVVLDGLKLYSGLSQPAVLERVEATRDALVRDAVALSEVVTPLAPEAARPLVPKQGAAAGGRLVMLSAAEAAADGAMRRRQVWGVVATVVLLTSAGAYHVWSERASYTPLPTVAGAPPGVGVVVDA
jgi:hypothetical protein